MEITINQMETIDLITPTHELAVKMGYKALATLLKVSNSAACKKISKRKYTINDVQTILSQYRRVMILDKK